jgi:hypothetical protein
MTGSLDKPMMLIRATVPSEVRRAGARRLTVECAWPPGQYLQHATQVRTAVSSAD